MPKLNINFSQGVQNPPQLGTVVLKPTQEGKMSYAQNVTVATDKYGVSVVTPGPYISSLGTGLANPIYWKALQSENPGAVNAKGQMWLAYNNSNTLDYIKGINSGQIPSFDNSHTTTLKSSTLISDIESGQYVTGGTNHEYVYASLVDSAGAGNAINTWITVFQTTTAAGVVPLSSSTAPGILPMVKTQFDGKIYIGNGQKIDRVDPSLTGSGLSAAVTLAAVGSSGSAIPYPFSFTAMGEWNGKLVGAVCSEINTGTTTSDFDKRNGGGTSKIYFWDIANNPTGNFLDYPIDSPCPYISVIFTDLSGNLFAFGGVNEGRTTIYEFNGYGFNTIFSYIGDLPRNRHSVIYDAQGRLLWQTCTGYLCRWDRKNDIFENIGVTNAVGGSTGGIFAHLQTMGDDFAVSGGTVVSKTSFSSEIFAGSGSGVYGAGTPLVISGIQDLPQKSIIRTVTVSLNKALQQGEILDINFYPQNNGTALGGTNLGSFDYSIDGGVASKNFRTFQTQVDEAAFGLAWRTSDGTSTVPGVVGMEVDYKEITTL